CCSGGIPPPRLSLPGEAIHMLSGFTGIVQASTFSNDGSLLTTGSSDGNLRLWGGPEAGE
ncbi:MAG TPA: WD40 repeat domain-containing protein, partial [Aggregatilineales bacterium]|nr:WD40 repeat domain-containing protein [Aggregatilineales bacterium]